MATWFGLGNDKRKLIEDIEKQRIETENKKATAYAEAMKMQATANYQGLTAGNASISNGLYGLTGQGMLSHPNQGGYTLQGLGQQVGAWVNVIPTTAAATTLWPPVQVGQAYYPNPYQHIEMPPPPLKPVPMDPPFSLDELEAAQTFIESLEMA